MVCLCIASGCAMLKGLGMTENNAIIRGIAIREAQTALAGEGVVMSEKEIGIMYDAIVESEAARIVASTVEANATASNAVKRVIEKYGPKITE